MAVTIFGSGRALDIVLRKFNTFHILDNPLKHVTLICNTCVTFERNFMPLYTVPIYIPHAIVSMMLVCRCKSSSTNSFSCEGLELIFYF